MAKTYVIGDIHGCYDEFIELTQQMGVTDDDLIVSLGDIVDRGNKSLELYQYFKNRRNAVVLMGNHERKHLKGVLNYSQEIVKVQFGNTYEEFLEWIRSLPYYYATNDALIVHAFFEHDKPIEEQKEEVLAGTTSGSRYLEEKYPDGEYWTDHYEGTKPIIYGHHVVGDTPKVLNNTYGIDTGACHAGKLTAIELPGFKVHQIQVTTDHWKEEQAKWQIPVLEAKNWEAMKIAQVHRQIDKLDYKQAPEIRAFLYRQRTWITSIEQLIEPVQSRLEALVSELEEKHGESFNKEVAKLRFKTFLFKARAGNLSLDDLRKVLDTPQKVIDLATQLNIEGVSKRTTD